MKQERLKQLAVSGQADIAKIQKDWEKIDDSTRESLQKEASSLQAAYERQRAEYREHGWYKSYSETAATPTKSVCRGGPMMRTCRGGIESLPIE